MATPEPLAGIDEFIRLTPRRAIDIDRVCHRKQASLVKALVLGPRRNVAALAGRQSGKSFGGSALAPMLCVLAQPGVNAIVVTATDASCEKMAFLPAVELNRTLGLGGKPTFAQGDRSMSFPNGSVVYYLGANNQRTIDRLRGTPNLVLCLIDEAGIYASDMLAEMIKAVRPGLRPRRGKLCVMGTPSPAGKQGTWWDITQNPEYDQHRFDYRDNDRVPDFGEVERTIDEDLKAQFPNLTPEQARLTAWFLREYMALFEVDLSEKVYQLTDKNLVDHIPEQDIHATGGDLGVSANDALVALGWTDGAHDIYVTDQEEAPGQDSIACADMVHAHNEKRHPLFIALDPGGLGQKTIKTAQGLYPEVPVVEAEKPPISLQVRATNYLLQGGAGWCLKIKRGSPLALQLAGPTWVDGIVGGKIDEHGQHSDLVPSLRYVAVKARKFLPDREAIEDEAQRAVRLVREAQEARMAMAKKRAKANAKPTAEDRFDDDSEDEALMDDGDDIDLE